MDKTTKALTLFESGFNCCQSVLAPFCRELGLDEDTTLKLTSGMGGGAKSGELCGAVSAAAMVLGMANGYGLRMDADAKEKTTDLTREFVSRFRERHGSSCCRELLGHCMSDEAERALIKEKGLTDTLCPGLVSSSVEILEEMLAPNHRQA
jgi:C_GCAxxG_C_C family probable redox protein